MWLIVQNIKIPKHVAPLYPSKHTHIVVFGMHLPVPAVSHTRQGLIVAEKQSLA